NAIIFCNRKRDIAVLHKSLLRHGFRAGALHGDMDQRARMASLEAFKTGEVDLIVCSDVAARGLDIPEVSHVFNFDVPVHSEDYVHRIGRTGRAGKPGTALTIVTQLDRKHIADIEKLVGRSIPWLEGAGIEDLGPPTHEEEFRPRVSAGRSGPAHRSGRASEERKPHTQNRKPEPRKPDAAEHRVPDPHRTVPNDRPVVGMGEHTPGFLLRPVRLKPKMVEEAE
ncbi:MAG: helicase-related protein, partial [Methylovirgula sp.]